MQKFSYSVTFEFEEQPPKTRRGTVEAASAGTGAARAINETQKALKPIRWTSVVCVLLERLQ